MKRKSKNTTMPKKSTTAPDVITDDLTQAIAQAESEVKELQETIAKLEAQANAESDGLKIEVPTDGSLFAQISGSIERARLESDEAAAQQQRQDLKASATALLEEKRRSLAELKSKQNEATVGIRLEEVRRRIASNVQYANEIAANYQNTLKSLEALNQEGYALYVQTLTPENAHIANSWDASHTKFAPSIDLAFKKTALHFVQTPTGGAVAEKVFK
jgi:Mg2+ and Co2+ transporter CorA